MQIVKGKVAVAQKTVVYGPEGIGKSTFASKFPSPLFIDTEGSTVHMDVTRTVRPSSWTMLMEQVKEIRNTHKICGTLVIDTADWAEMLCIDHICAKLNVKGIEDLGYGKGYTYLEEEFGRLLNLLQEVVNVGINVVLTAHAQMRKFEQPDELGAYDRFELKLEKKTSALVKEWADMVLFVNYKTIVVNVDNQGAAKGKNKAHGGHRVMYTSHHPCWDAKNRHGLPEEMPFDFAGIAGLFQDETAPIPPPSQHDQDIKAFIDNQKAAPAPDQIPVPPAPITAPAVPSYTVSDRVPKTLRDLMVPNEVTEAEIQAIVAKKGYYPADTPIENYDPNFVSGVLVGAWAQVFSAIEQARLPFEV